MAVMKENVGIEGTLGIEGNNKISVTFTFSLRGEEDLGPSRKVKGLFRGNKW